MNQPTWNNGVVHYYQSLPYRKHLIIPAQYWGKPMEWTVYVFTDNPETDGPSQITGSGGSINSLERALEIGQRIVDEQVESLLEILNPDEQQTAIAYYTDD